MEHWVFFILIKYNHERVDYDTSMGEIVPFLTSLT